jgi:hypothetical protein
MYLLIVKFAHFEIFFLEYGILFGESRSVKKEPMETLCGTFKFLKLIQFKFISDCSKYILKLQWSEDKCFNLTLNSEICCKANIGTRSPI